MYGSHDKNPRVQARNRDRREKASQLEELAHNRRGSVYKTDPELFTGEEDVRTKRTPKRGTPERAELERRIIELTAAGKTQLQISEELDTYSSFICRVMKEHRRV